MPISINLNRLQTLLAEMHCALPDGYNVTFIAMNASNPNAHVILTDMKPEDILRTMGEAGMPLQPNA
jgi:hypothetical protein